MADKLVVVGQGYVGLPLSMRAVVAGFDVVGFDTDVEQVKHLAAGESYVEDIPSAELAAALATDAASTKPFGYLASLPAPTWTYR